MSNEHGARGGPTNRLRSRSEESSSVWPPPGPHHNQVGRTAGSLAWDRANRICLDDDRLPIKNRRLNEPLQYRMLDVPVYIGAVRVSRQRLALHTVKHKQFCAISLSKGNSVGQSVVGILRQVGWAENSLECNA